MKHSVAISVLLHALAIGCAVWIAAFAAKRLIPVKPGIPGVSVSLNAETHTQCVHSQNTTATTEKNVETRLKNTGPESEKVASGRSDSAEHASINSDISGESRYFLELQKRIQAQERYPEEARRRGWQAIVEVEFRLNEQGQITEIHAVSQGNRPILEEAALAAVNAAAPFSAPPAGISHVFRIPIDFKIK